MLTRCENALLLNRYLTSFIPVFLAVNVFKGVLNNSLFCGIWVVTACLQAIIVQYGSVAFAVVQGGLSAKYWGISLMLGVCEFPIQQLINVIFRLGQRYKLHKNKKRSRKDGHLTTQRTNGEEHPHSA